MLKFSSKIWKYKGVKAAWFFVTLDKKTQAKIGTPKRRIGWGSVPVEVTIGNSTWKTSIFPDKGLGYILPVKASVRKKEGIAEGDTIDVTLKIDAQRLKK